MSKEFQVIISSDVIQNYAAFCKVKPDPASSCSRLLEKARLDFSFLSSFR